MLHYLLYLDKWQQLSPLLKFIRKLDDMWIFIFAAKEVEIVGNMADVIRLW